MYVRINLILIPSKILFSDKCMPRDNSIIPLFTSSPFLEFFYFRILISVLDKKLGVFKINFTQLILVYRHK